ncbi:tetratricopeptide repeat protein [Pseudonocardia sp. C8]|uniref:tetratricopeptide repeat protein n=1 Tax=Pseudonocardia sp. C8 TaxID=2762759 RepID=UPI0016433250|nr:tetratricopeptide repeat protein [Pseudonocardia sp. C8]MBC3194652.1 tetratricopeptide repeat protein [Pseudonocardia sp. C8]
MTTASPDQVASSAAHLADTGRRSDAERHLRAALAEHPQHVTLLRVLSAVLLRDATDDDRVEGLAAAEQVCALEPGREDGHRLRSLHLSGLGRHAEAVEAGFRSVTLAPDDAGAATGYARVLQRSGRLHDALQVAHRVVALAPQQAASHALLADVASDLGRRRLARDAYAETLRLDPGHAAARHDLAVLDSHERHPARALRGLIDAGRLAPDEPLVLQNVAAVLWQLAWRLRILLLLGVFVVIGVWSGTGAAAVPTRIAAAGVLVAAAALMRWETRTVPAGSGAVLRAAVRGDGPLAVTTAGLGIALLLYLAVAVTGVGFLAAGVWAVLLLLAVIAVVVGLVRTRRRR